ncbi:MAG: M28 family peptidase [Balneolaceae bacterium]|nr:M28 family peptidase [Balneolaceae bacterium]
MRPTCSLLLFLLLAFLAGCGEPEMREGPADTRALLQRVSADSIASTARTMTLRAAKLSSAGEEATGDPMARWVYSRLNSYGGNEGRLRLSYDRHPHRGGELVNVVAVLPGIQMEGRNRIYVVYSPYPVAPPEGAKNSSAGPAYLLELARVLTGAEFDATLVFLALDGREGGIPAAEAFTRQVNCRNLDIEAVLSVELGMASGEAPQVLRIVAEGFAPREELGDYQRALLASGGENDTPSRNLARFLRHTADDHVPGSPVELVYGDGRPGDPSTQGAFIRKDYTTVRLVGGLPENGMQEGRDAAWLAGVTRISVAALATMADAPARPRRVRMETAESGDRVRLRWKANKEPDLRGYRVVWRASTAAYWEHEAFIGDTTAYVPEIDTPAYYRFGVQAVDRFGNAGPAVFPLAVN